MPRRRPNRINRPVAGHTAKAFPAGLGSAGGQIRTAEQILGMQSQETAELATPLPRDLHPYPFGPGVPLVPAPLDPTRPTTGRAEPRIWEYPVSWNLPGQAGKLVPWRVLRQAAEHPLIRDCIRVRKQEVIDLEWDFTLTRRAVERAQRDQPGSSRLDVERQLREKLAPEIDRAVAFWACPDPGNGYTWPEWITQALEEHFVLDALAIYPRRTLGGDLYALEVLDGTTIKPLLDNRGGRPMPPQPAYQQVIHGFPRGEFTADTSDTDGQVIIPAGYSTDQLAYVRREVRTHTPYGLSSVENVLLDLDMWAKRVAWLRSEWTDGVMPSGWLINEQSATNAWTPAQAMEYERYLNDLLSGDTRERRRYRVLPPGIRPDESGLNLAEKYKPEFDLFLIKLVAAHFDITAHELGHVEAKGIGGAGHAEGQDRLNERKGRGPALKWLAAIITDLSRAHVGTPAELRFKFLGVEDEDDEEDAEQTRLDVAAGLMTINEARDARGRPRFTFPEADKAAVVSGSTLTFIEGAEERAAAAAEALAGGLSGQAEPDSGSGPQGGGRGRPSSTPSAADTDKAAEAAAYRRWVAKGRTARRFQLEHIVTPADLVKHDIDPARVTFAGKAQAPDGAALDRIATDLAPRLRETALAAVDADALAAAWLGRDATKGLSAAARWVAERAARLAEALARVVREALGEGWEAGEQDALEQLDDDAVSPAAERLRELLDDADVTITSVAESRFEELAEVLEEGVQRGAAASDLAGELRGVLDAPEWAETVAVTETARAMSAATQATYEANGIERKLWMLAPDQRVCPVCEANAAAGPIPTDDRFSSGDAFPPAHPHCRCALLPVFGDVDKAADRNQLKEYWLHGEGAKRWKTWTDLFNHLRRHVPEKRAKRMAAQWYHDRYGKWPGQHGDKDRKGPG